MNDGVTVTPMGLEQPLTLADRANLRARPEHHPVARVNAGDARLTQPS